MQLDELNLCVENKRSSPTEDHHPPPATNCTNNDNKRKRKDKRMTLSKIPVRQIKPSALIGRNIMVEDGDGCKNTNCIADENVLQIKQQEQNDKIIVEIENQSNKIGKEIENNGLNGIEENKQQSDISEQKIMASSTNNDNETILEAPEPFRCKYPSIIDQVLVIVDDLVDSKEPQLHDEQNNSEFKPETGDTIQLPPTNVEELEELENCLQEVCNNEDNSLNRHTSPTMITTSPTTLVDDGKLCANLAMEASIESGVAKCAQTPGCSRTSAANSITTTSTSKKEENTNNSTIVLNNQQEIKKSAIVVNRLDDKLCWRFKNGRLVFSESVLDDDDDEQDDGGGGGEQVVVDNNSINSCSDDEENIQDCDSVLYSKDLNKPKSRLKSLEDKLKQAGIQAYDTNQNILPAQEEDFCEFDVRQIQTNLTRYNGFYCQVYDEKHENTSSLSSDGDDEQICVINVRKFESKMGTDGEKTLKHNPDRDNLKSLLKKPGKTKENFKRTNNRVVFNENKNEFFDADYIILIREECDYDDEDDDGVCTCNQHEMVRLQCCEPNCNCNLYEGGGPQSPKFAPPIEFVDAVTLSPPEGYKDMELGEEEFLALHQQMRQRGHQRRAVCRECSATHDEDIDDDQDNEDETVGDECYSSDTENSVKHHHHQLSNDEQQHEEKEKTDQSQQTTPTTPPPNDSEHRIITETEDVERKIPSPSVGSPISGILKGGRLWKQQSTDVVGIVKTAEHTTDNITTSDEENNSRRSVRFIENETVTRDSCDGAPDTHPPTDEIDSNNKNKEQQPTSNSPDATEMMLTFKLGNHVLISNNSLKPNSAVRQLFPCTKPLLDKEEQSNHQQQQHFLVTAESLRAFEEAKRSKLPQIIQSGDTDESIKRAIERNTLRRSLIRYEPRPKKPIKKTDNSLVERIKQLTCDVDNTVVDDEMAARVSPPGEEAQQHNNKSFSPSSSSTASSNSSSITSSTYRKITDLFGHNNGKRTEDAKILPDIGGPTTQQQQQHYHDFDVKLNPDTRRQFLAPLTACVSSMSMNTDEYYYHLSGNHHQTTTSGGVGDERASMASSVGTEYSLEDIDDGLRNGDNEENKMIAPDVLAGTPSASESGDELAMFVQQDASRIERIKKKYHPEKGSKEEEDDEHDDYGFNHRPSVRGIKPRFGTTTEILQQIQNQLHQPPVAPPRVAWPYYSESGLSGTDNSNKQRNMNQMPLNYPFGQQYRPNSLQTDDNLYQNCANQQQQQQQRCVREVYRSNVNYSTAYYQSLPRNTTTTTVRSRPQSPPPLEMSKTYHQTMVYIPYNHIEPIQTTQQHPYYQQSNDYARVTNQNQINKRYIEPIYQQRVDPMLAKRANGPQHHLLNCSRSESPVPGQFSTARSTQTPSVAPSATCNYYPRYRPMVGPSSVGSNWNMDVTKMNRHSFPTTGVRFPPPADSISLTDSEILTIDYQQPVIQRQEFGIQKDSMPNSPTKPRFIERGVPEGAASVSPQDNQNVTSPTSPQNAALAATATATATATAATTKPLFYAMNV